MAFKVFISPRAQSEIEKAIDYYTIAGDEIPKNFIVSLGQTYSTLSINPYYKVVYKNIRCFKIRKFPYSLFFLIDEKRSLIKILSCFHNKLYPKKNP
jgi:toxin ParE1/3/4